MVFSTDKTAGPSRDSVTSAFSIHNNDIKDILFKIEMQTQLRILSHTQKD